MGVDFLVKKFEKKKKERKKEGFSIF